MYSSQKYLSYPANHCETQSIAGYQVGFPIRKSADQRVLSPPHGLSQSATSFIASYRQGIHQTPFMRLIRPSRRKTNRSQTCLPLRADVRSAPALRPVRCFAPPVGNNRGPNRSQSLDQVILIRCRISPAPRSVHRLGKTASACMPCLRHPEANPQTPQTQTRPASPSRGKDEQKRLVFLSLHDVKDHKGPNK